MIDRRKHFTSDAQRIADGQEWFHFRLKDGSMFSVLRHTLTEAKRALYQALERRDRERQEYNKKREIIDKILSNSKIKYRKEVRRKQIAHGEIDFNELTFWDLIDK